MDNLFPVKRIVRFILFWNFVSIDCFLPRSKCHRSWERVYDMPWYCVISRKRLRQRNVCQTLIQYLRLRQRGSPWHVILGSIFCLENMPPVSTLTVVLPFVCTTLLNSLLSMMNESIYLLFKHCTKLFNFYNFDQKCLISGVLKLLGANCDWESHSWSMGKSIHWTSSVKA